MRGAHALGMCRAITAPIEVALAACLRLIQGDHAMCAVLVACDCVICEHENDVCVSPDGSPSLFTVSRSRC